MGMYDSVAFSMKCPKCGKELNNFQSKSGNCILAVLEYWQVDNFYDYCFHCNIKVSFTLKHTVRKKIPITAYEMRVDDRKRKIPKELL
jgi:uncharacterized protein with PIN domain